VNLAPGKYVLHVKAVFPNGLYPEANAQYAFQILSPWWQTWWFKALILAAAGGLIVLLVRGYFRRKLERQRILLEKRQAIEKERSRIASDMHDDLGAGLSTIRFLSEKVRRNPVTDVTKNEIEKIAGISVELVENMNEIIWAMNEENDTLEDLLFYTRSYAKEYCEENQLQCVVDFPEQIPPVFVSGELRRNVFLTVKESLHNIVKYARATQVDFSIRVNDELTVVIKDNGAGFSTHEHNTGGNGLRNMRRRIESIGGQFAVLNGQGVTIKMQVPLERSQ
jgi:signal transduction histidine kinase